jgi:hypothetical protein
MRSKRSKQGGQPDILEPANGLTQYHEWSSSLQLCLRVRPNRAVSRNNDGCMVARDRAETAFLGDAWAFAHHRSIVLLLCGGVKSGAAERRREVDDYVAGKGEHGWRARLSVSDAVDEMEQRAARVILGLRVQLGSHVMSFGDVLIRRIWISDCGCIAILSLRAGEG